MKSYHEVCQRTFELTEPEDVLQLRKESHSFIYEMNRRGLITFSSQDGMSRQCHERPYVTGFLSATLWNRFSQFLQQASHIRIVVHRIDKNTRQQRQERSISVTQDRTRPKIVKHTWVHPLIPMNVYEFEKELLGLGATENVMLITCVDMRWCSLACRLVYDEPICLDDAWKTNAINSKDGLFIKVCQALSLAET
jgi:hypothetical protein